jgi:two-component system sensor histidine kinase TctE
MSPTWKVETDYSLRRRLFTVIGMVFLLTTVLLLLAAAEYGGRAADQAYDRLLAASALAIADQVYVADGRLEVDLPNSALEMLSLARRDRTFYRVVSPTGETVTGYGDLPLPGPPVTAAEPRFFNAAYAGETLRFVVLGRPLAEPRIQGWAVVQVGQSRLERGDLAREITVNALVLVLILMAMILLFVWIGINVALRPLAAIERNLRDRAPTDLKPLEMSVPREVRHLVVAINHFLDRLRTSVEAMQTFIADSAHQIRTPLASLRAQMELAADEPDPEARRQFLDKARRNAALTTRLTGQLLSHATVTHRTDTVPLACIEVRDIVQRVLSDAAFAAEERNIELVVDDAGGDTHGLGDHVALREALRNLVDNAIKYGPAGATVEVAIATDVENGMVVVEIRDRGPGIPDNEKDRAFERFHRAGRTDDGGSGLGLAIVRQVAERHGGIALIDRPGGGLIARFTIRSATEPAS